MILVLNKFLISLEFLIRRKVASTIERSFCLTLSYCLDYYCEISNIYRLWPSVQKANCIFAVDIVLSVLIQATRQFFLLVFRDDLTILTTSPCNLFSHLANFTPTISSNLSRHSSFPPIVIDYLYVTMTNASRKNFAFYRRNLSQFPQDSTTMQATNHFSECNTPPLKVTCFEHR